MSGARVTDGLGLFVEQRLRASQLGMTQALILGASEAGALTPIDTGTLLNSQYREVTTDGGAVRGRVGYTAEYALPVHDPSNPQRFRRAGAEKEFLTKGFARAEPAIAATLQRALKA